MNIWVDLVVAFAWCEETADEMARCDVRAEVEEILDVVVEVRASAVRNVIRDVSHRPWHIWQGSFVTLYIARF